MEETDVEEKEVEKVDVVLVEEEKKEEDAATKECENKESCTPLEGHGKGEDVPMMGQNEANHVESKELEKRAEDAVLEDVEIPEEDGDNDSDELFDDDSDGERSSASEEDDGSNMEVSLTDSEIEELVTEFLDVESKAAEAQEALEKESLAQVESDVRAELADNLHGDELEAAVSTEMETYIEEWETMLDNLETQSSLLLEQLDGAGIELPSLYKWIESQAPNGCCTEAWKKRAHWVGCQATSELNQSVRDAEEHLQSCRPVRRQHGRLLEEGASGFLSRKLSIEENVSKPTENSEKDWTSFNELIQSNCADNMPYGSANWASVYLASTPLQAANMGFKFPGVDEVEEIGEIDGTSSDPFYADAIANEKEIDLSEEQKKNFRKVREEDDAKITRKLQHNLKQRRQRNKSYSESIDKDALYGSMLLSDSCQPVSGELNSLQNVLANGNTVQNLETEMIFSNNTEKENPTGNGSCKRAHENEDEDAENKRQRTVIIDSDDELLVVEGKSVVTSCKPKSDKEIPSEGKETVDIIDVDILPSPGPKDPHLHTTDDSRNFRCTACFEVLKAPEVQRHPLLEVIVCRSCKSFVDDKIKDPVSSGDYCGWCGNCKELITCTSCNKLFCTICISRNFGEECLSECKAGWRCCCCLPVLLCQLISECDKALGDMLDSSSESDSDLSDAKIDVAISNKRRRKKRIRRILDDTELGEETKRKIALEKERQEHLKSMQVQSAGRSIAKCVAHANGHTAEGAGIGMLGDATEGYIVNVAREQDEEPVRLPPSISAKLKLHQVEGIRFMWENIVQSVRKVKSGDKGLGCILAHTMGLGKTFQVIAFLYAAMRCVDLGLKTALIVTPVNVLHNWRQEFVKWRPLEVKPLRVLMLEDVSRERRSDLLARWRIKGGVLLIGYAAFRNLSLGRHVKDRNAATEMCHALQHGPDFLVCDEAHMIKNTKADITQALKQVKTQRRIALTGSPLQNNLMEYYCMVDFVREGFLGSSHEFRNRFQNPIENGQHANSTSYDVKIMNQRSHILYEQLKGFVQRMDMNVVKKDLPPKTVFVITVKLSPLQRKLYKKFLDVHGFTSDKISSDRTIRRSCFFAGYQALAQIWNHPGLLQMVKEHRDNLRREDSVENFMMDDGSSDDNLENNDLLNGEKQRTKNDLILKRSDGVFNNEESNWWEDLVVEKIYKEVDYSGKMVLLLDILSMSADVGDKALVFSQSLPTLDLIELFLSKLPQKGREGKYWRQGKDWYRLDGSTEGSERQKIVERFNEPTNKRVKCTLISTRAGSLGINLHAANRVIIVDGSWNPTYDLQAIYRVWRYGQRKPVYAYRLMAHGTMEEKIYKRQVTKEGLAARVVDRQQIHRTMSKEEVLHLFDFGYDESIDVPEESQEVPIPSTLNSTGEDTLSDRNYLPLSYGATSSDKFMESLISKHYPRWIANYHEHESLLQENEAERLSKEEQDMAWQIYQQSFGWEEVNRISIDDILPSERKPEGNFDPFKRNLEGDFDSSERKPEGSVAPSNRKPERNSAPPESNAPQHSKASSRSRSSNQRKCTNLSHLLTLRSQGIKPGSTTVCGECLQEIGWENLNRDGKSR